MSSISWFSLVFYLLVACEIVLSQKQLYPTVKIHPPNLKINQVSLTQKGYIQFLRYVTDIPPISDFTFCIWMRSANLTHAHPLLSYSKHESQRYIRSWVSPYGKEIRLAVREMDIIRYPVHLKEHQWYHICQSWSTVTGHWHLYLNGKLKHHGDNTEASGIVLPKGGDIVVGQEYTDFDKGLDDGIEGDIFGFNMVLSATTPPSKNVNQSLNSLRRSSDDSHHSISVISQTLKLRSPKSETNRPQISFPQNKGETLVRGRRDMGHINPISFYSYLPYQPTQYSFEQQYVTAPVTVKHIYNSVTSDFETKTTASRLVEYSYNCLLGMGAPLSGKDVLISWTKTPVRIFGGAILKPVEPFCTYINI